jgi:triphosphatase
LWLDTVSKAERGELLARKRPFAPATRFAAARAFDAKDGAALWQDALARCSAMLLPNASALAGGSNDPEHMHQLRVAIRRLRCAMRELGPLVGLDAEPGWLAPLVELFRALGAGRDEVVLLAAVAPRLKQAGAPSTDWRAVDQPPSTPPAQLLRETGVQQAMLALLAASHAPPGDWPASKPPGEAVHYLRNRLSKLQAQARHAGRAFEHLPEEEQHRTRKRIKRLRYLAEFVGPLLGKRSAVKRFLKELAEAQDRLGEFQDLLVALPLYRAAAAREPGAWFAVGWITAERGTTTRACQQTLQGLGRAKPFW